MNQPTDSGFPQLDFPAERRRYMKFDPTFNTGTIVQIAVIVIGGFSLFYTMKQDQALQRQELEFVKASIVIERAGTKDQLKDIKDDVSTIQKSITIMSESIAVLRARSADKERK